LSPLVQTLSTLEKLVEEDDGVASLIRHGYEDGGFEQLRLEVCSCCSATAFTPR
jgi:hypothetical protein